METSHHFPAFREATGRHVRSASWYFPFAGLTLEASVVDWVVDYVRAGVMDYPMDRVMDCVMDRAVDQVADCVMDWAVDQVADCVVDWVGNCEVDCVVHWADWLLLPARPAQRLLNQKSRPPIMK
jgi:hypothetical protein